MDAYAPVKGKCVLWREAMNVEDEHDVTIKKPQKRVECSCFVEGHFWHYTVETIPNDCPDWRKCRYYIKST
jgi:hypothetical protein